MPAALICVSLEAHLDARSVVDVFMRLIQNLNIGTYGARSYCSISYGHNTSNARLLFSMTFPPNKKNVST